MGLLGSTNPFDMSDTDRFHEECGVFGVFGSEEASILTALGLHALQHRGQEAAGIVTYDGSAFHAHRALGHVGENFGADSDQMRRLSRACGHWS
jgi:amidophosphoribosyltransferase